MHEDPIATVLVVDTQPVIRLALRKILAQHGYKVIGETARGEVALRQIRRYVPDLVILDLELPDLDGLSVLDTIKRMPIVIPVLVFSSLPVAPYANLCKSLGASAFLDKKASPEELVAALDSMLACNDYPSLVQPDMT